MPVPEYVQEMLNRCTEELSSEPVMHIGFRVTGEAYQSAVALQEEWGLASLGETVGIIMKIGRASLRGEI